MDIFHAVFGVLGLMTGVLPCLLLCWFFWRRGLKKGVQRLTLQEITSIAKQALASEASYLAGQTTALAALQQVLEAIGKTTSDQAAASATTAPKS